MSFPFLQRRSSGRLVIDEAHDDAIKVWKAFAPIIWVLVEAYEFAASPLHELEWAGANRAVGIGMGLDIALAEDVLGKHRALITGQRCEHVGGGIVELEDCRVIVWGF